MTQAKNERVLGTLHPDGDSGSVRVQDTYDTGMDDLWSALTEPDWLARWISTVDGELRLGGEFRAAFFTSGWEGVGRVRECDPPHHFRIETTDADGSGAGAIDDRSPRTAIVRSSSSSRAASPWLSWRHTARVCRCTPKTWLRMLPAANLFRRNSVGAN